MANTLTSFYQTVITEFEEAQKVFVGTTAMTRACYRNYEPVVATIGQVLNVPLPGSVTTQVANRGAADPVFTDVAFTTKSITFDQNPQWGALIRDWEQFNSPEVIRNLIVDQALKGIRESINSYLTALVTTTNFNSYGSAASTTASDITPAQFLAGLSKLADSKVPVTDQPNMSCVVAPKVYYGILGDNNWTEYLIAGQLIATTAHETGRIATAYGVDIEYDQQMTTTGTAPNRTFTGLILHKYGLALATRPLPKPDTKVADFAYVMADDIPLRVILAYSPLKNGWTLNVDAGFGATVVRPECGYVFSTAE